MKANDPNPGAGPIGLAAPVCETLEQERAALGALGDTFAEHRSALAERDRERMDEVTHRTNELVARLDQLRQARQRQLRLLGRVLRVESDRIEDLVAALRKHPGGGATADRLLALRDGVRRQAGAAQEQCQAAEYALQYAIGLGHDLLHLLRTGGSTAPAQALYDQHGARSAAPASQSYVNRLG